MLHFLDLTSVCVENPEVISKLCDVNVTNKPKRINHEQKGRG